MARKFIPRQMTRRLMGVTLFETLLALSIGGMVIASSSVGLLRYTENVKVQAAAGVLSRLNIAANNYADDHYKTLVANAPQELPIDVLEPYFGANIRQDSFRSTYFLTTRTYDYTVPDPRGGTRTEKALQLLVVGEADPNGPLAATPELRADVANTAGGGAGFISTDILSCAQYTGTGVRPAGHVCGAFGNYSFANNAFPATNFNRGAAYVALVTKGDSSVYGDQLHRYDVGDPELNTMHTDIEMNDHDINNPRRITGANGIDFDGGLQNITTSSGQLNIQPAGDLKLAPGTGLVTIEDPGGAGNEPKIIGSRGRMQLGLKDDWVSLGPRDDVSFTGRNGTRTSKVGTSDLYAGTVTGSEINVEEVNSLHNDPHDPLRLQNRRNGEVIVGKRVRYNPSGAGTNYDISDGTLIAQHLKSQDVTCADCGGTLSNILPRWRHMGTYFIEDETRSPNGVTVPYPNCTGNRRGAINRSGPGIPNFNESNNDDRYTPKIILTPKEFTWNDANEDGFSQAYHVRFQATRKNLAQNWVVVPQVYGEAGAVRGVMGYANALASVFCVFTGGNEDPSTKSFGGFESNSGWRRLE